MHGDLFGSDPVSAPGIIFMLKQRHTFRFSRTFSGSILYKELKSFQNQRPFDEVRYIGGNSVGLAGIPKLNKQSLHLNWLLRDNLNTSHYLLQLLLFVQKSSHEEEFYPSQTAHSLSVPYVSFQQKWKHAFSLFCYAQNLCTDINILLT